MKNETLRAFLESFVIQEKYDDAFMLFKEIVVNKKFQFLWDTRDDVINKLWEKAKTEIYRGMPIGIGKYKKFPDHFISSISFVKEFITKENEIINKDFVKTLFTSNEIKIFLKKCLDETRKKKSSNI